MAKQKPLIDADGEVRERAPRAALFTVVKGCSRRRLYSCAAGQVRKSARPPSTLMVRPVM